MRQTINRRPSVRDFSYVNPAELCPCYSCSQFSPKVPLIRPNFKTWQIHSTGAEFLISMFELDLLINHFYTSRCKVHKTLLRMDFRLNRSFYDFFLHIQPWAERSEGSEERLAKRATTRCWKFYGSLLVLYIWKSLGSHDYQNWQQRQRLKLVL